jgi:hypothetical protein
VRGARPRALATPSRSMGPGKWMTTGSVAGMPIPMLAGRIVVWRGAVIRPAWITGAVGMATPTATASAVPTTARWVMTRWRRSGAPYVANRLSSPATRVDGEGNRHRLLRTSGTALWTARGS